MKILKGIHVLIPIFYPKVGFPVVNNFGLNQLLVNICGWWVLKECDWGRMIVLQTYFPDLEEPRPR